MFQILKNNRTVSKENINLNNYYWFENAFLQDEIDKIKEKVSQIDHVLGESLEEDNIYHTVNESREIEYEEVYGLDFVFEKVCDYANQANETWKFDLDGINRIDYLNLVKGNMVSRANSFRSSEFGRKLVFFLNLSDNEDGDGTILADIGNWMHLPNKIGALAFLPAYTVWELLTVKTSKQLMIGYVDGPPFK